jgi:chorismate mutase
MAVPGSLQKCVRVMIHVNTTRSAAEIKHVYLKGARELRPEWAYSDADIESVINQIAVEVGQ